MVSRFTTYRNKKKEELGLLQQQNRHNEEMIESLETELEMRDREVAEKEKEIRELQAQVDVMTPLILQFTSWKEKLSGVWKKDKEDESLDALLALYHNTKEVLQKGVSQKLRVERYIGKTMIQGLSKYHACKMFGLTSGEYQSTVKTTSVIKPTITKKKRSTASQIESLRVILDDILPVESGRDYRRLCTTVLSLYNQYVRKLKDRLAPGETTILSLE